ncbi:hypothetical protein [Clostridium sp. JN-1]|uniref:hypothetical protein n=1 Tax=Clostridium sp. JN-1 TaxID=2483110 RepID=UPI000F0B89E4|nr:hypothetical protein [Clostridium sp. JN-1]
MKLNKKTFIIIFCFIISIFMVGCGDDSSSNFNVGEKITLSADAPVCSSKDNVDKMINYLQNKNEQAIEDMENNGEAKVIPQGSDVTIVKLGTVIEIEDSDGQDWYIPSQSLK